MILTPRLFACSTVCTLVFMRTDLLAATLGTQRFLAIVFTHARAMALLAYITHSAVRTNLPSSTQLAKLASPLVLAVIVRAAHPAMGGALAVSTKILSTAHPAQGLALLMSANFGSLALAAVRLVRAVLTPAARIFYRPV